MRVPPDRPRPPIAPPIVPPIALVLGGLLGVVLGVAVARDLGAQLPGGAAAEATAARFPSLAARGYAVSGGAAPGYVEDRACAGCHRDLWSSYQAVGMARAFERAAPERAIESFPDEPFFHAPSGRYYRMDREGGRYLFRRWQLDDAGEPIHRIELPVDWIVGSGHTSRVYLFQTANGELYQLPLAWYAQTASWGMAPGFDRPDHQGLMRQVRRECIFCHNAFPDTPAASDLGDAPHEFPAELPEGIGCQRCHGPGARHAELAMSGAFAPGDLAAAIVDPGELEPERRDDVCFQCHLQPTVVFPGMRRFGRGTWAFRPGDDLADHVVHLDVEEDGRERSERFEINHHPYRLAQSRCREAAGRALSCLTCHDPHRKVPAAERAAHYRRACLGCHDASRHPAAEADGPVETADCVACHMPRRRTQDVVQVVMTDHRIVRRAADPETRLAPLAERDPVIVGIQPHWPERAPGGDLGRLYVAIAALRLAPLADALDQGERLVGGLAVPGLEPHLDLVRGQLRLGRHAAAAAALETLLPRFPGHPLLLEFRALARNARGDADGAVADLEGVLAVRPDRPEAAYNLGVLELKLGDAERAARLLEQAVAARPVLVNGWLQLGLAEAARGRPEAAIAALERALAIEPSFTRAYLELARLLDGQGRRGEALRLARHGARWAAHPQALRELEASWSGNPGTGD